MDKFSPRLFRPGRGSNALAKARRKVRILHANLLQSSFFFLSSSFWTKCWIIFFFFFFLLWSNGIPRRV